MEYMFHIHWKLRKGLGPQWVDKVSDIFLDDLPDETTAEEARQMAKEQFKQDRYKSGTSEQEYIIKDIQGG